MDPRWQPPVDVTEEGDHYVLRVDLPGIDDDVSVEITDGNLRVCGQRPRPFRSDRTVVVRSERPYGAFDRSFPIPSGLDSSSIGANFERGVLELYIPKPVAAVQRRHVPVVHAWAGA